MRNFTTEDFNGAGQYLIRMCPAEIAAQNDPELTFYGYIRTSYLSTIMYKVGYITNIWGLGKDLSNVYTLVAMSDGNVRLGYKDKKTKEWVLFQGEEDGVKGTQVLVDYLNNPELSQEYRFATQEEVVRVVMYQKSRWRN
jgi:hypothetical protein